MIGWLLLISSFASSLFCWAFSRFGKPFFVAKPRDWTPERHHQTKQGVPTMGGIVLIGLWLIGIMSPYAPKEWGSLGLAGLVLLSMGLLGVYDDWSKINRTGGISARAKFIMQNLCALGAVALWYFTNVGDAGYLWVPLFNNSFFVGPLMLLWGTFIMVAASNAVNLTDGLDGLAAGVVIVCFSATAYCAQIAHDSAILFGSVLAIGLFLGFLLFNRHPAKLFMGDTGALAFGALLGFYAVQLNITLLLPLIALVPVVETLSVMMQVAWYKRHKTRIFKMAPLHHHFELSGYSENQIVAGAAAISMLGSALACALFYFKN